MGLQLQIMFQIEQLECPMRLGSFGLIHLLIDSLYENYMYGFVVPLT